MNDDKLRAVLETYLAATKRAAMRAKAGYIRHGREPMERLLRSFDRLIVRIDAQLGPSRPLMEPK